MRSKKEKDICTDCKYFTCKYIALYGGFVEGCSSEKVTSVYVRDKQECFEPKEETK